MDPISEAYIFLIAEKSLIELANVPTEYTGLSPTVMISSKFGHDGKASVHGPRIKVSNINGKFSPTDHFVMTIGHEPKVVGNCKLKAKHVEDISDWIKLNHDHLLDVWHNGLDMDPVEMINKIKKLVP